MLSRILSLCFLSAAYSACPLSAAPVVLKAEDFSLHVSYFNAMEDENRVNLVSNREAWPWMVEQVPLFACSDREIEEIYYFRWWSLRKHLRKEEGGRRVFTEFLTKPKPVSSALGHQIAELRWLADQTVLDDYLLYWLRGNAGGPQDHLHKYSGWLPYAVQQRTLVTGDTAFAIGLLDDLVRDHERWVKERGRPDGLFFQYDVWDAMEESISGSRTKKNLRPTINSYLYGSATGIAALARLAGRAGLAAEYERKAEALRAATLATLWNPEAKFFEVVKEEGGFAGVREQLGFIPWYFGLPPKNAGYEAAWAQFKDEAGFRAPFGLATAERRHPQFRSHGTGTCEWDGAVWPYATSQTLTALGRVLRDYSQAEVSVRDWYEAFHTYVRSQRYDGKPYIGEYLDDKTGQWLKGRNERSRYYNHSTFADLVITGLAGLVPRADDTIKVYPLIPDDALAWFCLDGVRYHGHELTILWDRDGSRFGRGAGLIVLRDGVEVLRRSTLHEKQAGRGN
jgi:hypothetical protein